MMQAPQAFLAFLLGHLITDFLLQTNSMVARKMAGKARGYLHHGLLHYLAIATVVALVAPSNLLTWRFHAALLALTAVHLVFDWCKLTLTGSGRISDGIGAFLFDQAMHFLSIAVAVAWYTRLPLERIAGWGHRLQASSQTVLIVLVVYVATVFAGGYAVRYLTRPLLEKLTNGGGESREQLRNAGLYIGWLERTLIVTAVLMRSPATIGLVLAAKSIVRYSEMKSGGFAEYFLIGTLLSIILAIFGGIILLKTLHGTFDFAI